MKFLLFGATAINVVASIYLMLIAPIMIHGWNNTVFHADAALAVTVLLLIGIGGSIPGFVWRNTRPRPALLVTAIPAGIVVAGCVSRQ
ncbi:MAG: hypothetical protein WCE79_25900 [Xanthobacteraceae bacterium]